MDNQGVNAEKTVTLSIQNYEFLVESSIRYCLGRLSYAPAWECDLLSATLHLLTDSCLSVIERDIAEHLRTAEYDYVYLDISSRWRELLAEVRSEQAHRTRVGKD